MTKKLEPQTGTAFELRAGQPLRVTDLEGEQVADLTAFTRRHSANGSPRAAASTTRTRIYLTTGHLLYSNRSRPMFTIRRTTSAATISCSRPAARRRSRSSTRTNDYHPSCFENLAANLAPFGIAPGFDPDDAQHFHECRVDRRRAQDPAATLKAGDAIVLRAEMDLIVGLTACSAEMSNNYRFKPIGFEII